MPARDYGIYCIREKPKLRYINCLARVEAFYHHTEIMIVADLDI